MSLGTEYVNLYWVHVWDGATPVEEVVETLAGLVREGQIHYYGFSNVPAWCAAKAATLAEAQGWKPGRRRREDQQHGKRRRATSRKQPLRQREVGVLSG